MLASVCQAIPRTVLLQRACRRLRPEGPAATSVLAAADKKGIQRIETIPVRGRACVDVQPENHDLTVVLGAEVLPLSPADDLEVLVGDAGTADGYRIPRTGRVLRNWREADCWLEIFGSSLGGT